MITLCVVIYFGEMNAKFNIIAKCYEYVPGLYSFFIIDKDSKRGYKLTM